MKGKARRAKNPGKFRRMSGQMGKSKKVMKNAKFEMKIEENHEHAKNVNYENSPATNTGQAGMGA